MSAIHAALMGSYRTSNAGVMVSNYVAHVSWTEHAACQSNGQTHVLSVMNTPGSARWLMPRAVCHMAASRLRLSGEQECVRISPDRTRAGLYTCQLRTPTWALSKVLGPHCGRSRPHTGGGVRIPF
jgi:hypothetical protein